MGVSSMDLGFLKEAIHDLRDSIKANTKEVIKHTDAINMSNLLKMVELGMVSKEEIMGNSLYKNYQENFISSSNQKKKSLF